MSLAALAIQAVSGLATVAALFLTDEAGLRTVLALELSAQGISLVWCVCPTRTRYVDWMLSTPILLVSMAMFFRMRRGLVVDPLCSVWNPLVLNQVRLTVGLLAELGYIPPLRGVLAGVAFLATTFFLLYQTVDPTDPWSFGLFNAAYALWVLHEVTPLLSPDPKTVARDLLDVASKTGYCIFLLAYTLLHPT